MTLTEIVRFSNESEGSRSDEAKGRLRYGIYNCLLTGYVKATGIALNAAAFGITDIKAIFVQPVDCDGLFWFDLDTDTWVLTINDPADGLEIESDGADASNILVMYYGF
jgi:hypothetical protein